MLLAESMGVRCGPIRQSASTARRGACLKLPWPLRYLSPDLSPLTAPPCCTFPCLTPLTPFSLVHAEAADEVQSLKVNELSPHGRGGAGVGVGAGAGAGAGVVSSGVGALATPQRRALSTPLLTGGSPQIEVLRYVRSPIVIVRRVGACTRNAVQAHVALVSHA